MFVTKLYHYFCFIFWVLLWGMPVAGFSQTYPVHATVQLIPPYSLYVSDYYSLSREKYYSLSREKLVVTLLNRDLARPLLIIMYGMSASVQPHNL